jgi:hypothetical protein
VGKYDVLVLATGYEAEPIRGVEVTPNRDTPVDRKLRPDSVAGNLVRNPAFSVQWIRRDQPDFWTRDPVRRGRWASALIRVPVNRRCSVRVEFQPGNSAPLSIRWRTDPSKAEGREFKFGEEKKVIEVAADPLISPFEKGYLFLEVLIETDRPLIKICKHVSAVLIKP